MSCVKIFYGLRMEVVGFFKATKRKWEITIPIMRSMILLFSMFNRDLIVDGNCAA